MKKIKNLVVVCDYAYIEGGATSVAIQTALSMVDRIENVYYFSAVGPVCKELVNSDVYVICLNQNDINTEPNRLKAAIYGIWNRNSYRKFEYLLNKLEKDETIVHVHSWTKALSASVLSCALKKNFRVVLTLHDYFTVCPNGGLYNYKSKKSCELSPMSLKCIFCNCDKRSYIQKIWRVLRQAVIKEVLDDNCRIEYIYISEFSYKIINRYLKGKYYFIRDPYDLGDSVIYNPSNGRDYIYLGRISEEKGIDLFCKAFSELLKEKKILGKALVIGDGELKQSLERLYPEITFVGWQEHNKLYKYMSNARALVFPSRWYETAGLTPIEVMSHGIPCIISDNCAAQDYVVDGLNGLLFLNENIDDLKSKILSLEDNDKMMYLYNNIKKYDFNDFCLETYKNKLWELYLYTILERI